MVNYTLVSKIPERIGRLDELAYNLWWSWHNKARDVFRSLDYPLWSSSDHNPVKVLFEIDPDKLRIAAEDPVFLSMYDAAVQEMENDILSENTWFSRWHPGLTLGPVAYFSMEYALHNSLPIYAGGLGVLAGDMCKEASDLGLPFIGIGFMYPQGYFHQHVSSEGWQQEIYQQLNFDEAPINHLLTPDGKRAIAQVNLSDRIIYIGVWSVKVGRVNLYLLDTNLEENTPEDRQLSARLYTADPEMRIQQEIVLGMGGVRVLNKLGIQPSVWHANEGHSAFMSLERIREKVEAGVFFEQALSEVKSTTVFTTHTPVPSGHDCFMGGLIDKYFNSYWPLLGISRDRFMQLGRPDSRGQDGFNMTALAMNTASYRNAVSQLHEVETKKMWQIMWPGIPEVQLPISHITNGVHVPSWIDGQMLNLFVKYLGKECMQKQDDAELWGQIHNVPDEEIWAVHRAAKRRLIQLILGRAQLRWSEGDVTAQQVVTMGALLNPQVLTIGYARRFTEYKRPALILQDVARLQKIINNPWRPVQIVFAGKSHPADFAGKYHLHKVYEIAQDRGFQGRVVFVEDYDMRLARYLVHGIDVWLNNPYRMQEASGTSGMKAAINGIPNLSIRDGWWEEGYNHNNGWAIGEGPENAVSIDQDQNDAESLYTLLEQEVVPLYYNQDRAGVPHLWVKMVKESISSVIPRFSACRMVKEYTAQYYAKIFQQ